MVRQVPLKQRQRLLMRASYLRGGTTGSGTGYVYSSTLLLVSEKGEQWKIGE